MGKPEPPTREQIKVMKQYAENLKTEIITADKNGELKLDRVLSPWSLVLIEQVN